MRSLTPMQAASWVGRQSSSALGGVAAHLYAEFDGVISDSERFNDAVNALFARHPMLRLQINDEGQQQVAATSPPIKCDDFRHAPPEMCLRLLAAKRQRMTNQQLLRDKGYPCEFSLSLLPDGQSRLHIDMDMIAADAESFRIIVEDLARLYQSHAVAAEWIMEVPWFHYLDKRLHDRQLQALSAQDRRWWQARLVTLPPAPPLAATEKACQSHRIATLLDRESSQALQACARQHHLTLSALFLALFSLTVNTGLAQPALRINVPTFFRDPTISNVENMIGDFSELLLYSSEINHDISLLLYAQQTMAQLHELLAHNHYSGISIMRDLSRLHGQLQYSPVVFTAGFGIRGGTLFSDCVREQLGTLGWVISQGPQVALDAQVAWDGDAILINWDVRLDAFLPGQAEAMFSHFHQLLLRLAQAPQEIHQPVTQWLPRPPPTAPAREEPMSQPLSPLQQAYLLGRSEQWPLGGVAMHDYRIFRGHLSPQRFCQRLTELVAHFAALRTVIDGEKQQQFILPTMPPLLEQIDLSTASAAEAEQQLNQLRQHYQQIRHDLALPPWKIILIALPGDSEYCVLTSFDALILDGQGISRILARLFDQRPLDDVATHLPAGGSAISTATREEAQKWWQEKLKEAVTPSHLPWLQPLSDITRPIWRRESKTLAAATVKKLFRIGSAQGLFSNTVLCAIVLDTLALWSDDESVLVGVPTALPSDEKQPTNQSTFIVVNYHRSGTLAENAQQLQEDILNGLQHLAWSGVDLARQLAPRNARHPALPIIITNCLGWETLALDAPVEEEEGLTQTPQVALDIRLMRDNRGNLRLVADYVTQALSPLHIQAILEAIWQRMQSIVASGTLNTPVREVLNYAHYAQNSEPSPLAGDDFLANIARNLSYGSSEQTALICGDQRWSWQALGEQVAAMANGLIERQLQPGNVVAIYLPRSPEHVMISLACALTGIIRVPIDINSPPERTRYLLDNCHPDLVICHENAGIVGSITPDELRSANLSLPPLAGESASALPSYYLYTSGTTGKPKCVVLNNRATANVLSQTIHNWQISARDVFISVTPLHHDMSVFDLFAAMSVGATLVLPAMHQEKDAPGWSRLVEEHQVTLWCSVPAILEMLLECAEVAQLSSLRLIAQGGDYINRPTMQRLRALPAAPRLFSLGGPTETTIWSIWHEITAEDVTQIPYGQPLPGNHYFICHDSGEHCPCGVAGRIHTAGINLACGYLAEGEIVQHDFVTLTTPEGEAVRAFRTGDIGYYRPDGVIMFLTRINGYVKIRGIRVSLPEIEDVFRQHRAIKDIVVVDYTPADNSEKSLGAVCLLAEDKMPEIAELRTFAQRYLPASHIPLRFIARKAFPLSTNGKIDRHALRAELAEATTSPAKPSTTPAHHPTEQKIVDIYCAAINHPAPTTWNASMPFITMGLKFSHLSVIREKLNAEFHCHLSGQDLIKCKNVADVCALLRG